MYTTRQANFHCLYQLTVQRFALWTEGCELRKQFLLNVRREQDVRIVKDADNFRRNDGFDLSRYGSVKTGYIG